MGAYTAAVLADNPRHYWRCADPGGHYLHDIGSAPLALQFETNYSLSLPYIGPVSDGGSVSLNGISAAWYLTGETLIGPVTLEAWYWQVFRQPSVQYLLELDVPGRTNQLGALYLENGQAKLQGGGATRAIGSTPSEQHWHHMVGTVDAAGNGLLYIDAIQVAAAAVGAGGSHAYQITLGGINPPAANHFCGSVAEVAIYPTVLSPTRINAHFLAADNIPSRPVFKAFGEFSIVTAITQLDTDVLSKVLAAVQKTFPTT